MNVPRDPAGAPRTIPLLGAGAPHGADPPREPRATPLLGGPAADPRTAAELRGGAPPLLDVHELHVSFALPGGRELRAVDGVSFTLARGETLAIVGESGSGKSVCAHTLMGLTRAPGTAISGSARLDGEELLRMGESQLRRVRGRRMAMVFQDPQSSLNPVHRVGNQIAEQIRAHEPLVSKGAALARAVELMERVGIPRAKERVRAYPHELSGGQRQRVMIAMALSLGAPLLLADEPTTALDVTVQAQILAELKRLRAQEDLGIVLITHDFGIVADIADRVAVMRDGQIVEHGSTARVLEAPEHPYTRGLLDALVPFRVLRPTRAARARRDVDSGADTADPIAVAAAVHAGSPPRALLEVDDLRVEYRARGLRPQPHVALAGVSLSVTAGETLAIVGESGCGKTTLLRTIAGLLQPSAGRVSFEGKLGMVFQDPHASLNPRRRVGATLERSLRAAGLARDAAAAEVPRLLEQVGLSAAHAARFPHELSGGQRQRVGIARALACLLGPHNEGSSDAGNDPRAASASRLVLLDEPVSSLDASLRRGVIELLARLQAELGCAYVVVSHDLGAVEAVADRIAVMHAGEIVELGGAEEVLCNPQHPYTRELLAARPKLPDGVVSSLWQDSETPPPSPREHPTEDAPPGGRR